MGSAIAGGPNTCRQPADGLSTARQAFERVVAEFMARPQLRHNLERLASASLALHDAGLADLEDRYGRDRGSFGGRILPGVIACPVGSEAGERFADAARADDSAVA